MTEPGFREIQLSTKQVVFLFMAFVVVAVGIFLLGVSVGRGVTAGQISADTNNPAEPAVEVLPASPAVQGSAPPEADKLTYHDGLQKTPSTPPPPMPDSPPDTTATPAAGSPATKPATASPKAAAPPAKTTGTLFIQVDSFSSADNARRQVTQLKAKGFPAFVFEAPGGGAKYKTRVGPFPDGAAQDAMIAKLRREGYKPSPIR